MANPEQSQRRQDPWTLWHTNVFGKIPRVPLRPEFVHPGCTNIEGDCATNADVIVVISREWDRTPSPKFVQTRLHSDDQPNPNR